MIERDPCNIFISEESWNELDLLGTCQDGAAENIYMTFPFLIYLSAFVQKTKR